MTPSDLIKQSKRIVLKIGSAILVDSETGTVKLNWLKTLSKDLSELSKQGKEIVIVSSGAIALGRSSLGISKKISPANIPLAQKQAAAALGQVILSEAYDKSFAPYDMQTALVLLTPKDTEERKPHLNARATIQTLLEHDKVPVINENDTVSTEEIRFGDNDRLASRVAQMIEADLLIQLSTTDGLYTDNPDQNENAEHISVVEVLTDEMTAMAKDAAAGISTGGMKSKLIAADIATKAGVHMVITNGLCDHPLKQLENKDTKSTLFMAHVKHQNPRKRWIAGHVKPEGIITVDDGAVTALNNGRSLLPVGVTKISGQFEYGDPVEVQDQNGHKIAMGLVGYKSDEAEKIIGQSSDEIASILGYARNAAIIHRSNLVLNNN